MVGGTRNDDTSTDIVEMLELDSPGFVARGNVLDFFYIFCHAVYIAYVLHIIIMLHRA